MFFVGLVSASLVNKNKCVPPLITPPPVPGGTLIQAQVVLRHGSRTPGENFSVIEETGEWFCDDISALVPRYHAAPMENPRIYHENWNSDFVRYKPSCREKDLITMGMQQHVELGNMFRSYLVDNLKFLNSDFEPNVVYPRATMVDRALKSCQGFLQGMYPPMSKDEVIQILTDTDSCRLLDPSEDYCSELIPQKDDFIASDVWNNYFTNFSAKWKATLEPIIGSWDPKKVKKFVSWAVMVDCTDHKMPDYFTEELANDCIEFLGFWIYGLNDNDKYRGVASAPLFREMFRMADDLLAMKSRSKFIILSSHDTELGALLPALGQKEDYAPPVRSNFLFELWDVDGTIMARFVFNGRVLPISFLDNKTLVKYSNLKGEMYRSGSLDHCFVPEWKRY